MDQHLTLEQVQRVADREVADGSEIERHVEECRRCASAVFGAQRLKGAVRDAMRSETAPASLRREVTLRGSRPDSSAWWIAAAAVVAILVSAAIVQRERSQTALSELVDLHVTLLASAHPIDVVSTDRHTVKPWFEGRLSFGVPVPELSLTPFRLIGGRVVYWRGNPVACLLIGKGAHRVSVFVFREDNAPNVVNTSFHGVRAASWHEPGLTIVAIADVPFADLEQLRAAFTRP